MEMLELGVFGDGKGFGDSKGKTLEGTLRRLPCRPCMCVCTFGFGDRKRTLIIGFEFGDLEGKGYLRNEKGSGNWEGSDLKRKQKKVNWVRVFV